MVLLLAQYSYDWDEQNRLKGLAHRPTSNPSALLSGFSYKLGVDGRREQVSETVHHPQSSSIAVVNRTITYSHNGANWLLGEKREEVRQLRAGGTQEETVATSYGYDSVGNRLLGVTERRNGVGPEAALQSRVEEENQYDVGQPLGNDWLPSTLTLPIGSTSL